MACNNLFIVWGSNKGQHRSISLLLRPSSPDKWSLIWSTATCYFSQQGGCFSGMDRSNLKQELQKRSIHFQQLLNGKLNSSLLIWVLDDGGKWLEIFQSLTCGPEKSQEFHKTFSSGVCSPLTLLVHPVRDPHRDPGSGRGHFQDPQPRTNLH